MSVSKAKGNVLNSIMTFLPDNRPVTAIQIVEDYKKCPKNFTPIFRSYDQDSDADIFKENILIGRRSARYLCISKSEGSTEHIVETLRVIGEKELCKEPGFSIINRTADSNQKAWRKKQLVYKLTKRETATAAVTDIIVCSKQKQAPDGFQVAGDMNGALICFKIGQLAHRPLPPTPANGVENNDSELNLNRLSLNLKNTINSILPSANNNDYENLKNNLFISPKRPAPLPPVTPGGGSDNQSEVRGVPFKLNPNLSTTSSFQMPSFDVKANLDKLDYQFLLERQILCTLKSNQSKNPFFK